MLVERLVEAIGARVIFGELPDGLHGCYDHRHHAVFVDSRLDHVAQKSTLVHELGHAYFRHAGDSPKWEREASSWAALALIRGCELTKAVAAHDTIEAVADELEVLPRDVRNYITACPLHTIAEPWDCAGMPG